MYILIVDDHADARIIVRKTLESRGHQVVEAVDGKDALEKARKNKPDMIISDILMPVMDGFSLCREIRQDPILKGIPFVFYTATYVDDRDEKLALELGADCFIRKPADPVKFISAISEVADEEKKGRISVPHPDPMNEKGYLKLYNERLILKLEKKMLDLEREMAQRQQIDAELTLFRALADQSNDSYFVSDTETGRLFDVNRRACENLGYPRDELLAKRITDIDVSMPDLVAWQRVVAKARKDGAIIRETIHRRKDEQTFPVEVSAKIVTHQGREYSVAIARDIRERKKARQAVEESRKRYHSLVASSADQIFMLDLNGVFLESNNHVAHFGLEKGNELVGKSVNEVHPGANGKRYREKMDEVVRKKSVVRFEHRMDSPDGRVIEHEDTLYPIIIDKKLFAIGGICRNITEHKLMESQFRQSQKMEAIGRLAGGVAHDFNNMLSIIMGYTDLALGKISPLDPLHSDLTEIMKAGQRSAGITRQLLAFARKQTINPRVMDFNKEIEESIKMLGRLIGEDIDLRFIPGDSLWPVFIDPAQVDQILANLAINARDAIEGVGELSIETNNVTFDENYCRLRTDFFPGQYVMLEFSDSGTGMDEATRDRIFEPFFTTKGKDKGTGLGLSTVFGIVKQNKGFINVYSEPGSGTTFKLCFPRHMGPAQKIEKEKKQGPMTGTETILLVEDEKQILGLCIQMLEMKGYTVISASLPGEAILLCEKYNKKIHLLITDVIMPNMSGKELRERIKKLQPGIKSLFMSGYTADIIASRGVLDKGIDFIHKPFSIHDLAKKVRQVLDGG